MSSLPKLPTALTGTVSHTLTGGADFFGGDVGKFAKQTGGLGADPLHYQGDSSGSGAGAPFSISQAEVDANKQQILDLANAQYAANKTFSNNDQASRDVARGQLAKALTDQAQHSFQQSLPKTEELLNSQHLLNGSGLGQELARQQGYLNTNIADQVGIQGLNDINLRTNQLQAGETNLNTAQQGALSRGFSLEDFIRQANVAKSIGQATAPQGGGKGGQVGGALAGAGTGAQVGSIFPGYGTAIGAGVGGVAGYLGAGGGGGSSGGGFGKAGNQQVVPYAGLGR